MPPIPPSRTFPLTRERSHAASVALARSLAPTPPRPTLSEMAVYAYPDGTRSATQGQQEWAVLPPVLATALDQWVEGEQWKEVRRDARPSTAKHRAESAFIDWLIRSECNFEQAAGGGAPPTASLAKFLDTVLKAIPSIASKVGTLDLTTPSVRLPAAPEPPFPPQPSYPPPVGGDTETRSPVDELELAVGCAMLDKLIDTMSREHSGSAKVLNAVRAVVLPRIYLEGDLALKGGWNSLSSRVKFFLSLNPHAVAHRALKWESDTLARELARCREGMRLWGWAIWRNVLRGTKRMESILSRIDFMIAARHRRLRLHTVFQAWLNYRDSEHTAKSLSMVHQMLQPLTEGSPGEDIVGSIQRVQTLLGEKNKTIATLQSQLNKAYERITRLNEQVSSLSRKVEDTTERSLKAIDKHLDAERRLEESKEREEALERQVANLLARLDEEKAAGQAWRKVGLVMLDEIELLGPNHPQARRIRQLRKTGDARRRRSRFRRKRSTRHILRPRLSEEWLDVPTRDESEDDSDQDSASEAPGIVMNPAAFRGDEVDELNRGILRDWGNRVLAAEGANEFGRVANYDRFTSFTMETRDCLLYARLITILLRGKSEGCEEGEGDVAGGDDESATALRHVSFGTYTRKSSRNAFTSGKCAAFRQAVASGAPAPSSVTALFGDLPSMAYVSRAGVILDFLAAILGYRLPVSQGDIADGIRTANVVLMSVLYISCADPITYGMVTPAREAPPTLSELVPFDPRAGIESPSDLLTAYIASSRRKRGCESHQRFVMWQLFNTLHVEGGRQQQPQNAKGGEDTVSMPSEARLLKILANRGDDAEGLEALADAIRRNTPAIKRVFRHYATSASNNGVQAMSLSDWRDCMIDAGIFPKVLKPQEGEQAFLMSNEHTAEDDVHGMNPDHPLVLREFVESLVLMADLLDRHANHMHSSVTAPQGGAALSPTAEWGIPLTHPPQLSLATSFVILLDTYIIPNAAQSEFDSVKKSVRAEEVQSIMRKYENPIRVVFFTYVKGHVDAGACLDLQDFQRCIKDCGLINSEFTHQSLNMIFGNCASDANDGRMNLSTFNDTLVFIALFKQPSPFTPLAKRLEYFLTRQFFTALRLKIPALNHHMKLLSQGVLESTKGLSAAGRVAQQKIKDRAVQREGSNTSGFTAMCRNLSPSFSPLGPQ